MNSPYVAFLMGGILALFLTISIFQLRDNHKSTVEKGFFLSGNTVYIVQPVNRDNIKVLEEMMKEKGKK